MQIAGTVFGSAFYLKRAAMKTHSVTTAKAVCAVFCGKAVEERAAAEASRLLT